MIYFILLSVCCNFNQCSALLEGRLRLRKMQVNLLFRSACTTFNLLCLIEIRLHLGNAQIYLAFLSICTNFA